MARPSPTPPTAPRAAPRYLLTYAALLAVMSNTWQYLAGIEFVLLAFFTAFLLRYFAAKGTHPLALAVVFVSWCVPLC